VPFGDTEGCIYSHFLISLVKDVFLEEKVILFFVTYNWLVSAVHSSLDLLIFWLLFF
jgi:hypothetical protein